MPIAVSRCCAAEASAPKPTSSAGSGPPKPPAGSATSSTPTTPAVLVVDEVGYLPPRPVRGNLVFKLISRR